MPRIAVGTRVGLRFLTQAERRLVEAIRAAGAEGLPLKRMPTGCGSHTWWGLCREGVVRTEQRPTKKGGRGTFLFAD